MRINTMSPTQAAVLAYDYALPPDSGHDCDTTVPANHRVDTTPMLAMGVSMRPDKDAQCLRTYLGYSLLVLAEMKSVHALLRELCTTQYGLIVMADTTTIIMLESMRRYMEPDVDKCNQDPPDFKRLMEQALGRFSHGNQSAMSYVGDNVWSKPRKFLHVLDSGVKSARQGIGRWCFYASQHHRENGAADNYGFSQTAIVAGALVVVSAVGGGLTVGEVAGIALRVPAH